MAIYQFDRFMLDPQDRTLCADGTPLDLNARYLDALILLVEQAGRLVTKDRFMDAVWQGIPVTDEALTQCIRTLRRTLGDSASAPRFIETVPRHGYRFVAAVDASAPVAAAAPFPSAPSPRFARTALAAIAGGALAGLMGGLAYGFTGATRPLLPGTGASAVMLVLLCVTLVMATTGAAGVGLGLAVAERWGRRPVALIAGGAIGGLVVGAVVKLLGGDLFTLLFGQAPGDITGAAEGLALGGATGLALLAARAIRDDGRGIAAAAAIGGATGGLIVLAGGRLLGGSLALLATAFPASRLRLDGLGRFFGESGFGPVTQTATAAAEAALFAACIVAAVRFAERRWRDQDGGI
ncbi:transcriptional regulator [Sphingomonas sp. 2R-10]|uniref:winged helix-turn-helix domain-containing protein n=1 Tax=Sphingomonas sp. 2R-10 TaxID=3045148 RepID=UPI000F7B24DC|nr:transcriptional regulator [Sphingomonas sp. 2R-10]MDJ0276995.1 transcriptional regulator [Sphingomonas sp. 2R-10]